jgi:hypothetical protein
VDKFPLLIRNLQEHIHDVSVKLSACASEHLCPRSGEGASRRVGTPAHDDIQRVGHHRDAGVQRNFLAAQPQRVSCGVDSLVMAKSY